MPHPIMIVGAGLAGLWTALKLAPRQVSVISAAPLGQGAASAWAQGGIAAALDQQDSAALHAEDTQRAGAGMSNHHIAELLARHIPDEIEALVKLGIQFDRDDAEIFLLSREAGHQKRRIVRAKGDMAGQAIMRGITHAALNAEHITLIENHIVGRLAHEDGQVGGVFVKDDAAWELIPAAAVLLATGGIGQLYQMTTNPPQALGTGLAMAAIAGAQIADAEFVQFHPTALSIGIDPAPLATEALRGEGALLVDHHGHRFMLEVDQTAELAPRDIVARAVARAVEQGGAFLDARKITSVDLTAHFPIICKACQQIGLDPQKDLIPIAPAAHYHMGGIACDQYGQSSLDGLWVCGEAAANGLHGANRLAGNSLGEALVFASFAAQHIKAGARNITPKPLQYKSQNNINTSMVKEKLKRIMSDHVGVARDHQGLTSALSQIQKMEAQYQGSIENENMLTAAKIITAAALKRTESRGAHYRRDFPSQNPSQAEHHMLTLSEIDDI